MYVKKIFEIDFGAEKINDFGIFSNYPYFPVIFFIFN